MLSTERQEFEDQLAVLFGGFPQFLTAPRVESYWRGLQKMPLSVFTRCVDQALGESGHDKLPTVNTIWQISRQLRAHTADSRPSAPALQLGPVHAYGNRALLNWLRKNGAVSAKSLAKIVSEKNRLCDAYALICQDEPEASFELRDKLFEVWGSVREDVPASEIAPAMERYA